MSIHEAALWAAYLNTRYVVLAEGGEISLRVGERSPELDALLVARGCDTWCLITAWNPGSERLDSATNRARNESLRRELDAVGSTRLDAEGRGEDGDWPAEESFLVMGLAESQAVDLARRHGQIAIVWGVRGATAQLVDCRTRKGDPT